MIPVEGIEVERPDVLSDRQAMIEAFDHLEAIEQQIVCIIVQRLGFGQSTYGPFRENDARDEAHEAMEEVADALVYAAKRLVRMRRVARLDRDTDPAEVMSREE